jgi:hypothetical protein
LLRTGEIVAVDHSVFRSALTPPSWEQRLLAACLAGPAAASHRAGSARSRNDEVSLARAVRNALIRAGHHFD